MEQKLRTFIAVKIKPEPELLELIDHCKETLKNGTIKWVEENNLHLTLKFIGETSGIQVNQIVNIMENIGLISFPFSFKLKGLSYFKSNGQLRVLFAEIVELNELKMFFLKLEDDLSNFGFVKETREFKPHLTLGRIKFLKNKKQFYNHVEKFRDKEIQKVEVSEIIYYQSILKPQGPKYIPLKIVKLNSLL